MSDSVADIVTEMELYVRQTDEEEAVLVKFPHANTDLNLLAARVNSYATRRGFKEKRDNLPEALMLVVSELSEALEALREMPSDSDLEDLSIVTTYQDKKSPHGFCMEIADAIIRLLDISASCRIDIMSAIIFKMHYNETRPYKHGKNF